ncbi:hypothetical protein [Campylobacter magnus]|uniref:Uncharacterized protein n=1 Tax=Campylobacter magnus TaxID=3026462 RepID=A0ABT8T620_9BACT|nr:hypothetical protein [Campylobacter magnus]MDO2408933.1 hypothetical protein [Campylobacter magnus]
MIVLMLLPFILLYSLIVSYFCSVVIYRLCITKKYYNFFFAVLLYVASGISSLLLGFLFCPLFVWYFWRNKIIFVKITLIASICIMCLGFWQAELPQRLIVNLLPVKLEIVNDDFEYIENPKQNFGRKHNIDFDNFERKESKNFLNFKYTKYNIYACDDFTCKGDKKYVGYMWKPWSERSFLGGCVNAVGRCLGSIEQYKTKFEYFVEYSNLPQFNKRK